ncbi:hypothetical protein PHAVU_007G108700, partial [Phaseolus vulgaris]
RWGRVIDVFISRRLDAGNRRFGFVRFQRVMDAHVLERRLDAIWIGLWKLWVNLPKFSRKETHKPELGGERKNEQARMTWRQKNPPRTFAQVVRDGDESASKKAMDNSVVCFQVAVESTKWLEECFVGRLIELKNVMSIKESFFLSGINSVKLRSLGEKFVLLSCDEAGLLEEIVAGNKDLLDGIFESIVPWDDSFAVGKKFVWVRCRGIPLALWSNQCFESVGSLVGALVEVDNATVTREVVEFARLRVRIPVGSDTRMVKQVQINGTFCNVSFEEERFVRRSPKQVWMNAEKVVQSTHWNRS